MMGRDPGARLRVWTMGGWGREEGREEGRERVGVREGGKQRGRGGGTTDGAPDVVRQFPETEVFPVE